MISNDNLQILVDSSWQDDVPTVDGSKDEEGHLNQLVSIADLINEVFKSDPENKMLPILAHKCWEYSTNISDKSTALIACQICHVLQTMG